MRENVVSLLNMEVAEVARKVGLSELTPIQEKAIPAVLSGYHVLIVAPTGSGKTEAAMLPILSMMCERRSEVSPITVIYVTPLRALNRDMLRRLGSLGEMLGFKVAVRHGDTPSTARRLMSLSPPHILITTPETLAYVIVNKDLRNYLKNVKWVVIDEFHELINSKRGTHLLVDLERLERIAGRYQRVALSASIGDLNKIKSVLAPGRLVIDVSIPMSRESEIKVVTVQPGFPVGSESRNAVVDKVSELLSRFRNLIIFTNTRDEAEWLGTMLSKRGFSVEVHHGSLSKKVRERVEKELKEGLLKAVVSTSTLELGIDVGYVDAVIQVSSPRQAVKLLQRVGRSSHKLWLKAVGYIVTNNNLDDVVESLVIARRTSSYNLEKPNIFKGSLDVLSHLLVGLGLEGGFTPDEALKILRRSYPYAELSEEDLQKVIDLLINLKYLRKQPNNTYVTTNKGRIYYLKTTMIVESSQYDVIDIVTGSHIGGLDEEFVALSVNENSNMVLSGRVWRVINVDDETKKIFVELSSSEEELIPTWSGENIPVDFKVAREVCALRRMVISGSNVSNYLGFTNNTDVLGYLRTVLRDHVSRGYPLPTEKEVLIEVSRGDNVLVVIHSCLGSRGNLGLAHVVSYYLSRALGVKPVIKSDPYRIYVLIPGSVSESLTSTLLERLLSDLGDEGIINYLRESLLKSTLAEYVARRVLVRLGIMPEDTPPQVVRTLVNRYMGHEIVSKEVLNEILTRYIDLEVLENFFRWTKSGYLTKKIVVVSELSPIALEGLKVAGGYGRVEVEKLPRSVVIELLKKRLLEKEVKLYCLKCGNSWCDVVKNLPERVSCSKCGYSVIGVYFGSEDLSSLVRKVIKYGAKYEFLVTEEEKRKYEELVASARLVLSFGKKAVIALAARGVGPHNAVKALSSNSEEEFYLSLYELERNYVRTRKYWDASK
ncbi:MAG: DEAD/DEAH box helicase [Desulfurococcaceae archaeon TW002]